VDAQLLLRDGAVYLRKRCPEHGWHEALVLSDADWALRAAKYNKPGAVPYDFATTVDQGCPHDCGLCPEHQQHTCIGLIEVTTRCNLGCPTCFADAGGRSGSAEGYDLSLAQVEAMLDRFVEAEGRPEVVQISGGEPTIHPQLLDILAAAKARDIRHVMLNTNGLRIAQDPDLVEQLTRYEPSIYLQFDGLCDSTYRTLRGRDLRAIKQRALDHLSRTNLAVVLVATVARGVNDDELGDILHYGLEHPSVLGVAYQPMTFAGRCFGSDPLHRMTLTNVLHVLEAQTAGLFRVTDFLPVPCPHPECSACTYAFVDAGGPETQIVPIPRLVKVDDYLDFITNRAAPELSDEIQHALEALWSSAAMMGTEKTTGNLTCVACGIDVPLPADPEALKPHFFMVQVHGFMDEHTFDLKRLMKCCVHQLLPDGRAVPFCAYNTLGYREEVRVAQARRQVGTRIA
jgi:uncharacterized radical SAM superfamily Fe-S cluster-containing enzyme